MEDEYDVNEYTDEQLFQILDLNNPSDRELEAKILSMVRKYSDFGNESGDKLSQFFIDIYSRFFEVENAAEEGDQTEGFTSAIQENGISASPLSEINQTGNTMIGVANMGNKVEDNVKLTKQLDYSKDSLNPLLKQTIKRIISIDSQYRNQQVNSPSTNFTFNLSEPLRDVVSLSLYSIQIPYTWYTVNSDFGGNFFYLKGNAPGIINGLHDYKIGIPSGNYTPAGLSNAINASIKELASTYTDISFATTQSIYNNGVTDQNSGTGKCTLQLDVMKVYNEGNYTLKFPNWSSPINDGFNNEKSTTIAGYLGFNNQEYYCSSIYSYPFFPTSIISKSTYSSATLSKKTSFQIVPYIGNSYLTADISFTPITVALDVSILDSITIPNMVNLMNTTMRNNAKFDADFTECTLVNITNPKQFGNGESYVKFSCKLKNTIAPIVRNLKLAAVFPNDSDGVVNNSIFYGSNSLYAFSDSVKDSSNNVICEFNELLAENSILQSSYTTDITKIEFQCIAGPGYDNSYNNIVVNIKNSTYTLTSLITAINTSIENVIASKINFDANITMSSDLNTNYLKIHTQIDNRYTNNDYSIYVTVGSCNLNAILGLPTTLNTNNPVNTIYTNPNYEFVTVSFSENDKIYIVPTANGINDTNGFVITFDIGNTYSNGANLANYLTNKIAGYFDPVTGLFPFSGSSVTYSVISGFKLELNIMTHINQSFYRLNLTSNGGNFIWTTLAFDISGSPPEQTGFSYDLIDYSNNSYTIPNNKPIRGNEITIFDGSNNVFYFSPSNTVDVFNTSNNQYLITLTIPDTNTDTTINDGGTNYAINELLISINSQLSNTIAKGTVFSLIPLSNGQTVIKCKFNINLVFTTKDFNLVFYDPYSFASCFSSTSKNTSTSLQNATWDTTLGWLLGFRNAISYDLSEYFTESSSVNYCNLTGDTNVSTNLYNYFLIMLDDYVQNHLNDGLVTITNQETSLSHGPFVNVCDPVTGLTVARPADYGTPGVYYTSQELYAFNQQVQSQLVKAKSYSKGPFVQDIFGIIPVKTSGMSIGSVYVEFGGSLQNQQRLYFGPVNIHRMTIKLLNDRGNLVDLNNANWSFSFICEQLYKSGVS
jgi:hypothetical protein